MGPEYRMGYRVETLLKFGISPQKLSGPLITPLISHKFNMVSPFINIELHFTVYYLLFFNLLLCSFVC